MSMTPPPLSWNQPQPRHRPQPSYQQQNKPFGNVQYQGMVQVRTYMSRYLHIYPPHLQGQQVRSKNYPFPSKAVSQADYQDDYGGRGGGGGGPLDNMRSLEHYLPEHGNQRGQGEGPSYTYE